MKLWSPCSQYETVITMYFTINRVSQLFHNWLYPTSTSIEINLNIIAYRSGIYSVSHNLRTRINTWYSIWMLVILESCVYTKPATSHYYKIVQNLFNSLKKENSGISVNGISSTVAKNTGLRVNYIKVKCLSKHMK